MVQVGPGTAEPVQPKTEYIEPRTGLTVRFRKFTEPNLDQGSSSGRFRFGPRFRTEPRQAYMRKVWFSSCKAMCLSHRQLTGTGRPWNVVSVTRADPVERPSLVKAD